jgi:hypothetical protein
MVSSLYQDAGAKNLLTWSKKPLDWAHNYAPLHPGRMKVGVNKNNLSTHTRFARYLKNVLLALKTLFRSVGCTITCRSLLIM